MGKTKVGAAADAAGAVTHRDTTARVLIERVFRRWGEARGLTSAERSVAWNLVRGLSNKEIARALGKSAATVRAQVACCLRKSSSASRSALAFRFLEETIAELAKEHARAL